MGFCLLFKRLALSFQGRWKKLSHLFKVTTTAALHLYMSLFPFPSSLSCDATHLRYHSLAFSYSIFPHLYSIQGVFFSFLRGMFDFIDRHDSPFFPSLLSVLSFLFFFIIPTPQLRFFITCLDSISPFLPHTAFVFLSAGHEVIPLYIPPALSVWFLYTLSITGHRFPFPFSSLVSVRARAVSILTLRAFSFCVLGEIPRNKLT